MKGLVLAIFVSNVFGAAALAQENALDVTLESFERCNNWARHYCLTGAHNEAVNQKLLRAKKRGYIITTRMIRSYAQRTRPDSLVQTTENRN